MPRLSPNTNQVVIALARWEGEGGATALLNGAVYDRDTTILMTLGDRDGRILDCLGAAVVSGWNDLPTAVQRAIFMQATRGGTANAMWLKSQIARYLHNHKDDDFNA